MKKLIPLFTLLCLLAACGGGSNTPESHYEKNGIAFTSPAGWAVTEEEDSTPTNHYLALEKLGDNESGLVTLIWFQMEMDQDELLEQYQNSLLDNYGFTGITFSTIRNATFNNIPAQAVSYAMTVHGLDHRGEIYVFGSRERTVTVGLIKQEALEDIERNAEGFEVFENSFSLK